MQELKLEKGRPEDNGRLAKEIRCYDLLDSLGIEYMRVDHDAADNMEVCQAIDEVLGATICKTADRVLSAYDPRQQIICDKGFLQSAGYLKSIFCPCIIHGGVSRHNARFSKCTGTYER